MLWIRFAVEDDGYTHLKDVVQETFGSVCKDGFAMRNLTLASEILCWSESLRSRFEEEVSYIKFINYASL